MNNNYIIFIRQNIYNIPQIIKYLTVVDIN